METDRNNKQEFKITLKIWKSNGSVKTYHTKKTKRFYAIVKAEDFQKSYIKVVYGKEQSNYEKMEIIYNDAFCETKHELIELFKAFIDV